MNSSDEQMMATKIRRDADRLCEMTGVPVPPELERVEGRERERNARRLFALADFLEQVADRIADRLDAAIEAAVDRIEAGLEPDDGEQ